MPQQDDAKTKALRLAAEDILRNFDSNPKPKPMPNRLSTPGVRNQSSAISRRQFVLNGAHSLSTVPPGSVIAVCYKNKSRYMLRVYWRGEGPNDKPCWTAYDYEIPHS